ncbi:MAG: phage portal protein [Oscillospiraceae bacterium]
MKIANFLANLFYTASTDAEGNKTINVAQYVDANTAVAVEEMAIFSCVNMLADIISKCEFKTYQGGKQVTGPEYYLWNFEPNRNQNSVQFIKEFVARLLLNNEALMVDAGGQLFIADAYNHDEYSMRDDVFSGVTCNNFTFSKPFLARDVIFVKLNDADIKAAMSGLFSLYSKAIAEAFDKYQSSGGKSGILHITGTARGLPTFETDLETLMNDRFKKFFNSKNAVLPLLDGFEYTPQTTESAKKTTNEVSDIRSLTEQALERAANGFHISPQLLRGDVTNIDDAINATLTFAADPIIKQLQVEIVRKRYGLEAVQRGDYLRIDSTRIKHIDVFDVAEKADKLIAARLYNTNEIRTKIGDEKIDAPWAYEYQQTKNYETVGGGENSGT